MAGQRLIDLSHEIEDGMITYPGLPAPAIRDWLSREGSRGRYAAGTTFHIGKIDMIANTGTYVDAPFHRYDGDMDLAGFPLEAVADLDGCVVRATRRPSRALDAVAFAGREIRGKAVLVHTGWDAHWRTEAYGTGHPFLTRAATEALVAGGAALVGIDSLNIDDTADGARPAHTLLLGAGIPIVEHLTNLGALPDAGFRFFAVPPKVKGMGSFPVRAFGKLGALVAALVLSAACWTTDVSEAERVALITVRDFVPYGLDAKRPRARESFKRVNFFDGTYSLEYEFDEDSIIYLHTSIDVERNAADARLFSSAERAAFSAGLRASGLALRDDSAPPYPDADESYFGSVVVDTSRVGHVVTVRRGGTVYTVILTGLTFDSYDAWPSLLNPKLAYLDSLAVRRRP